MLDALRFPQMSRKGVDTSEPSVLSVKFDSVSGTSGSDSPVGREVRVRRGVGVPVLTLVSQRALMRRTVLDSL